MTIKIVILISTLFLTTGCVNKKIDGINQQINLITDSYPIRQVENSTDDKVANVIDLEYTNKCDQDRAVISPASLGVTATKFDLIWDELIKNKNQTYYIYEYGECTPDGALIKNITKCTESLCGKEILKDSNKIWLGTVTWSGDIEDPRSSLEEYMLSRKDIASFYTFEPFEYSFEKKAWKFIFYYANTKDTKAMEGYINNQNLTDAKIIESIGYDMDGKILFKYDKYDSEGYPQR